MAHVGLKFFSLFLEAPVVQGYIVSLESKAVKG